MKQGDVLGIGVSYSSRGSTKRDARCEVFVCIAKLSSPLTTGNEMMTSVVLETRNEVVSAALETRNEVAVSAALKCSPIVFCLPTVLASNYCLGTIDETH
jgi:hypothetical protein